MLGEDVSNINEAFAYALDCNLATVEHMATLKRKSATEYTRQIAIAQLMVDWSREFNIDCSRTRLDDVDFAGGAVARWAESVERTFR